MESDSFGMTLHLCATAIHYIYFVLKRMLTPDLTLGTDKFTLALNEMASVFDPRLLSNGVQDTGRMLWYLQDLLEGLVTLLRTTQLNNPYAPISESTPIERFPEVTPPSLEGDNSSWFDYDNGDNDGEGWGHVLRSGTSYPARQQRQQQQGSGFHNRPIPDEYPAIWATSPSQYRPTTSVY